MPRRRRRSGPGSWPSSPRAPMPRSGLTAERVTAAAARLADAEGLDSVSLARLASELDVRPASLFNHVDGLSGLRRQLQLRGLREMTAVAEKAAVGRAGEEAVIAVAK